MVHKNVIVTFIICIGTLGAVFILTRNTAKAVTPVDHISLVSPLQIKDGEAGIPEWEKRLMTGAYSTSTVVDLTTSSIDADTDTTLTAQVSKDFLARYLINQKNTGDPTIDNKTASQIANDVISHVPVNSQAKQYTRADITVVTDNDATKNTYKAKVNAIMLKYTPKKIIDPIKITSNALATQSESTIAQLDPLILIYKGILSDSLKLSVPKSAVPDHVIFLNALSGALDNISEMRYLISDPLRGYIGFQHYQQSSIVLSVALDNLARYVNPITQ